MDGDIGGIVARVNQVPPHAPAVGMDTHANPTGFTDGDVRTTLVQMAQSIILQAQVITAQAKRQGVPRENPPFQHHG